MWTYIRSLRTGFLVLGAIVFLVVNFLFYFSTHGFLQEGYTPPSTGSSIPFVLGTAAVLAVLAAVGARGRAFSVGFVLALLALTVLSATSCTEQWADPIAYLRQEQRSRARRAEREVKVAADLARWRDSVHRVGMWRAWGARRLLILRRCVESARARDSTGALPDSMAIAAVDSDCANPDMLANRGHLGTGWDWRFEPTSIDRYRIEGFPRASLDLPGPRFTIDENAFLVERRTAEAPAMIAVTPVPTMRQLRQCIDSALAAGAAKPRILEDLHESRRCLPLQDASASAWADTARIAMHIGDNPRENYVISHQYFPVWRSANVYDLVARPAYGQSGRSFLLSAAGGVHLTTEKRLPTQNDPAPPQCEIEPTAPCG